MYQMVLRDKQYVYVCPYMYMCVFVCDVDAGEW